MKEFIKYIKNKRNLVLTKEISNFINSDIFNKKNLNKKIIIIDLGSGKNFLIAKKINKNSKLSKKFLVLNYDFFKKKEITKYKKINLNCYSINKTRLKKSNVIILSDTLHHIFYKKIDYDEIGKYLSKLLEITDYIFIKDHFAETYFDSIILKIMDFIGNKDNSKANLPSNYFKKKNFLEMCNKYKIKIKNIRTKTEYYPKAILFFGNPKLHFSLQLQKKIK